MADDDEKGDQTTELEDLREALQKERSLRRKAEAKLTAFGDLDPDQAQADQKELEELRAGKGKVPDDVAAEWARKEKALQDAHAADKAKWDEETAKLRGGLHRTFLETAARAALEKHGAHVDIMLPHVLNRARVVEGDDGSMREQVVDAEGNVLMTTGRGTGDRSLMEEVERMAADENWAMGFKADGISGSGAHKAGSPAPTPGYKGQPKRVPMAEIDLEKMASGEQVPAEWEESG